MAIWSGLGARRKLPSGRWQAKIPDPTFQGDGRPPYITAPHTFPTKAAAEYWLKAQEVEIIRGTWVHPEKAASDMAEQARREAIEAMTVAQWGELWLADKAGLAHGSRRAHKSRFDCHIKPALGNIRLIDLTPEHIHGMFKRMAREGLKTDVVKQSLSNLLITAIEDPRTALTENPLKRVNMKAIPTKPPKEKYLFSPAEIDLIVEHIAPPAKALVILLADAGLRINEALALTRERVNLDSERPYVEVVHSLHRSDESKTLDTGNIKTPTGRRRVLIQQKTAAALAAHMEQFCAPGYDAPIFPHKHYRTQFARDNDLSKCFKAAKDAAGLVIPEDKEAGFHALRHYSATKYGQAGASLNALMRRYGWSDPKVAMLYQRADEDYDAMILEQMQERATREREAVVAGDVIDLQTRKRRA